MRSFKYDIKPFPDFYEDMLIFRWFNEKFIHNNEKIRNTESTIQQKA